MRMPNQTPPVARGISTGPAKNGTGPSSIPCDLCMAACNQLSGFAKTLCVMACNATVC